MKKPQIKKGYYYHLLDIYRQSPVHIPLMNVMMRLALTTKSAHSISYIKHNYQNSEKEISDWYNTHTLFFGFAFFRSGTTFLADFLNKNLLDTIVQHEPNVSDYLYYTKALQSEVVTNNYIEDYRLKEIYHRIHPYPIRVYGEINPFLRRHCGALKQFCPQAKQFHLVRDGSDVVRSLMTRKFFGPNHFWTSLIKPPPGDEIIEHWKELSRFEKICCLWKTDNEFLCSNVPHLIQFEKLVSDYDYFKTVLMDFLEIGYIDSETWEKDIGKVMNQSPTHSFPSFKDWEDDEKKIFEKICGEEMSKLGY